MRRWVLPWLATFIVLPMMASAHPLSEMRLDETSWYGLSTLNETLSALDFRLEQKEHLTLSGEEDWRGPLVLLSGAEVDHPDALHRWVQDGGQVLVADDLGTLAPVHEVFGVRLHATRPDHADLWLAHPALLAVDREGLHPLTRGVDRVVTNHPAHLEGRGRAVLAFQDGTGLLYELQLGAGRILLLSDPSMLTNQMLPFEDNTRLAINLIWHLCRGTEGQCEARVVGQGGHLQVRAQREQAREATSWWTGAERAWQRWTAPLPLPDALVRGLTWILAMGVLFASLLLLPRSPRRARTSREREAAVRGAQGASPDMEEVEASWNQALQTLRKRAMASLWAGVDRGVVAPTSAPKRTLNELFALVENDLRLSGASVSRRDVHWLQKTWAALEVEELEGSSRRWTREDFRRTLDVYRRLHAALELSEDAAVPLSENEDHA